jgi:hypothetical protein
VVFVMRVGLGPETRSVRGSKEPWMISLTAKTKVSPEDDADLMEIDSFRNLGPGISTQVAGCAIDQHG